MVKMTEEPSDFEGKWPDPRERSAPARVMDITEQLTHESRIALAAAAEITRLRAEAEALRADAATDRKLVQAAEKFIQPVLQELQFERGHGSLAVHNLRLVLIEAMKANAKHAEIDAARAAQGVKP